MMNADVLLDADDDDDDDDDEDELCRCGVVNYIISFSSLSSFVY